MNEPRHFPHRWLWTWDHSTNWDLNASGLIDFGANNRYLKPPETFVEDYRRLIESASQRGVNGIIIWGLLRDAHGGVEAAKEVCRLGRERGVGIIAGIGTSEYGGFYYEGEHPFSADVYAREHPDAMVPSQLRGRPKLCPNHPGVVQWLREGTQWLLETVGVAGVNMENGDFSACPCPRCIEARTAMGGDDPDYFKDMLAAMTPIIEQATKTNPDVILSYATYTGFVPGNDPSWKSFRHMRQPVMGVDNPFFARRTPEHVLAQWNVGGMLHTERLPMMTFLDDGHPVDFKSPFWPAGLRPPTKRNLAFIHQGSQWHKRSDPKGPTRYNCEIASIKEGCMRSAESGLDGVIIHGEVSDRLVPLEINYLAFDHFTRKPFDSLREFAATTLAPKLGGPERAVQFVEWLARSEKQPLTEEEGKRLRSITGELQQSVERQGGERYDEWRRWRWLLYTTGVVKLSPSSVSPYGLYF